MLFIIVSRELFFIVPETPKWIYLLRRKEGRNKEGRKEIKRHKEGREKEKDTRKEGRKKNEVERKDTRK